MTKVIAATEWLYDMMQGELEHIYYSTPEDALVVRGHMQSLANFLKGGPVGENVPQWSVEKRADEDDIGRDMYWVVWRKS